MPSFEEYRLSILSGHNYLEEASNNEVDITDLEYQSDYNSKSIIIDCEKTLDELNLTFFETLNDFKVNYVKYYLDKFESNLNDEDVDIIDTNEISGKYNANKLELDTLYDDLLFLKYRILINLKALNKDIRAGETSETIAINKHNKRFDNLEDLDSGMEELLNDKTFLYNSNLIYIFNLSLASTVICYVIYKNLSK